MAHFPNRLLAESPLLGPVLACWGEVRLPDAWLVAGAIAQTIWNHRFGLPPTNGINDIDFVYYDSSDLSEAAEAAHAARLRTSFAGIPAWLDVKNQARVHLWYERKFGKPLLPYVSTADAISTFPTTATAIGVRPGTSTLAIEAPFGLDDLLGGVVRANKRQIPRAVYEAKVEQVAQGLAGAHDHSLGLGPIAVPVAMRAVSVIGERQDLSCLRSFADLCIAGRSLGRLADVRVQCPMPQDSRRRPA